MISPPLPPVAAPELISIIPVEPLLEVPEKKFMAPLTPETPAFDVLITIAPLEVDTPPPVYIEITPPVKTFASPADVRIFPAIAWLISTEKDMSPPLPCVAKPVLSWKAPLDPLLAVPVVNKIAPLIPSSPALGVLIVKEPLVKCPEYPVAISIKPPVTGIASPAATKTPPPTASE
jgi:hypothetical protein